MKLLRLFLPVTLSFVLAACACHRIREGVVTGKRVRMGLQFDPMQTGPFFRMSQPDVYWVDVQGQNAKGHLVKKHIAVFRADYKRISVGDHWSAASGFDTHFCKECK